MSSKETFDRKKKRDLRIPIRLVSITQYRLKNMHYSIQKRKPLLKKRGGVSSNIKKREGGKRSYAETWVDPVEPAQVSP